MAVYRKGRDIAAMFARAAYVFKDGELVVEAGEVTRYRWGRALRVRPKPEKAMVRRLDAYYQQRYGLALGWFDFPDAAIARETPFAEVPCGA